MHKDNKISKRNRIFLIGLVTLIAIATYAITKIYTVRESNSAQEASTIPSPKASESPNNNQCEKINEQMVEIDTDIDVSVETKSNNFASRISTKKRSHHGGATKVGQDTLSLALEWLASIQDDDGKFNCQRYGGSDKSNIVTTSLALLAFSNSGHSTRYGKYRKNVRKAVTWLLAQKKPNNNLFGNYSMDTPYALLALSECWVMNEDKELGNTVQEIADFIMKKQLSDGGWGKDIHSTDSDLSTTLLYSYALVISRRAGAMIDEDMWKAAKKHLQSQVKNLSDGLAYVPGATDPQSLFTSDVTTTAFVNLLLAFYGESRSSPYILSTADWLYYKILGNQAESTNDTPYGTPPKIGANSIIKEAEPDYTEWKYIANAFYRLGTRNKYWRTLSPVFQRYVSKLQIRAGDNIGSFSPTVYDRPTFVRRYGRIGTTVEVCLLLSIFYAYDTHGIMPPLRKKPY